MELPKLNEYYTTIGKSTLAKDLVYITQMNFQEETPYQIMHILSTLLLWLKNFYTAIHQYPTLYNFLAISQDELFHWE